MSLFCISYQITLGDADDSMSVKKAASYLTFIILCLLHSTISVRVVKWVGGWLRVRQTDTIVEMCVCAFGGGVKYYTMMKKAPSRARWTWYLTIPSPSYVFFYSSSSFSVQGSWAQKNRMSADELKSTMWEGVGSGDI